MIRVTANTNRRAPAMSAEDAAVIADGFGIRQPLASSDIGHGLDEAGLSRLVDKVHDAMVDDALIGIDTISISELRMDLCRPMRDIEAAVQRLLDAGHVRQVAGRSTGVYMLCRANSPAPAPVEKPEPKKAKSKAGKKASNVKLTADQAG